jgi:hypothetical protein
MFVVSPSLVRETPRAFDLMGREEGDSTVWRELHRNTGHSPLRWSQLDDWTLDPHQVPLSILPLTKSYPLDPRRGLSPPLLPAIRCPPLFRGPCIGGRTDRVVNQASTNSAGSVTHSPWGHCRLQPSGGGGPVRPDLGTQ